MKRAILCLCVLALLAAAGCDDDSSTNDNPEIGIIMKLAVGNRWTYEITLLDSLGNILSVDTDYTHIYRDTTINNERWYVISDESPLKVNSMLTHRDDGLWACGPPESMLAKYPADIYDTWTDGNGYHRFWLRAKGVTVTVPKGTFSTYKYVRKSSDGLGPDSCLFYYAPGYGQVKSRFWPDDDDRVEYRTELIDMVLNY